jgi:hypothetical protein
MDAKPFGYLLSQIKPPVWWLFSASLASEDFCEKGTSSESGHTLLLIRTSLFENET